MLHRSETLKLSVHHDGQAGAQRLALLHAVRRQHDQAARFDHVIQRVPQEAVGAWIHAGRLLHQN